MHNVMITVLDIVVIKWFSFEGGSTCGHIPPLHGPRQPEWGDGVLCYVLHTSECHRDCERGRGGSNMHHGRCQRKVGDNVSLCVYKT